MGEQRVDARTVLAAAELVPQLHEAIQHTPRPDGEAIHALTVGAEIAAGTLALFGLARTELSRIADHTEQKSQSVLADYVQLRGQAIPEAEDYSFPRYDGVTPAEGKIHTDEASFLALRYAMLTEQQLAKEHPEILQTADRLITLGSTNPQINERLQRVAVSAWRYILNGETDDMADSLSGTHKIHQTAHSLHSLLQEKAGISEDMIHRLAHGLNAGEEAVAKLIPLVGTADHELRKVLDAFRNNPAEMQKYLSQLVSNFIKEGPEVSEDKMLGILDGLVASIEGLEIPSTEDSYQQLASALATRMVQRYPEEIFGTGSEQNPMFSRIKTLAGIAAVFDSHQERELSLLRSAGVVKYTELTQQSDPSKDSTEPTRR